LRTIAAAESNLPKVIFCCGAIELLQRKPTNQPERRLAMTKSHVPSTKPVTRKQIGNLLDKVGQRLSRNKNLISAPFERAVRKHSPKIIDECAAIVLKYHDAVAEIVRVDRKIAPIYPDWVDKPMHSELEAVGPAEYDLGDVEQWLHEKQKTGVAGGKEIYEHLKSADDLKDHLNLRDLQAIQKLGIVVFRKHFVGKAVFGWKSVVLDRRGYLFVPFLVEIGDEVKLDWRWLGYDWSANNPALRFRK